MRALITIPHYFKYDAKGTYGSEGKTSERKVNSLRNSILSLKRLFEEPQYYSKIGSRENISSRHSKHIPSVKKCIKRLCGKK